MSIRSEWIFAPYCALEKKIKKEKFNVSKPFVSIIEPFLTCTFCILAYYLCSASDTTDDELGHVSQSESRSGDGWNSILSNRKGCYWRFLGQKGQPLHCVCLQHHLIWNGSICHIAHCARLFQNQNQPTKKNKTILFYMVQAYVNSTFLQTFWDLTWKQN